MCFDLSGEELGAGGVSVRAEEERGEEEGEEDRFTNFKTSRGLCAKMPRVLADDEATALLQCPGDVATSSFKILKFVRICLLCAAKNTTNLKIGEKYVYVRQNQKVKT